MTPLVELYEAANLSRALDLGARLIGVNNRDLHTFQTDLEHTLRLRTPSRGPPVGERERRSDPRGRDRLESAGVAAMLVGETLVSRPDIAAAVDELLGR